MPQTMEKAKIFAPYCEPINQLTKLIHAEESFLRSKSQSASPDIPRLLRNTVHYRVHNSPPLVPILSQMNPAHLSLFPYNPV